MAPGTHTSYVYFGGNRSLFGWHTEEMEFNSININLGGGNKVWYGVPRRYYDKFYRVAGTFFPAMAKKCPVFLRHKRVVISPALLKKYGIPVNRVSAPTLTT